MDKVRFTIGSNHVWQGFHSEGDTGMVGALVFVTADTLRAVTDHLQNDLHTKPFDKVHNAPTEDWETLAFGDSGTLVSPLDGITPLYRLALAEAVIVQRFDPLGGRTHDRHESDGTITKVPNGGWVNEETIDGFVGGWSDVDDTFEPVCHGFVIDRQMVAEGRTNAPLIDTEYSRTKRETGGVQEYVVDVYLPLSVSVQVGKGDEDMAKGIAEEWFVEQHIATRIKEALEDTIWYPGDSPNKVEVGEA